MTEALYADILKTVVAAMAASKEQAALVCGDAQGVSYAAKRLYQDDPTFHNVAQWAVRKISEAIDRESSAASMLHEAEIDRRRIERDDDAMGKAEREERGKR